MRFLKIIQNKSKFVFYKSLFHRDSIWFVAIQDDFEEDDEEEEGEEGEDDEELGDTHDEL